MISALGSNTKPALRPASGIAMDHQLPMQRSHARAVAVVIAAFTAAVVLWLWSRTVPRIHRSEIRTATVELGLFREEVALRVIVTPLRSLMLDSLDAGRVEEIAATDGSAVNKGDLLYRLSNPQLQLDLVARQADRAQQISNLSVLRAEQESGRTTHRARVLNLEFQLEEARKQHERYVSLMQNGAIAAVILQDAQDRLAQQRRLVDEEDVRSNVEQQIKSSGIEQMESAVRELETGMRVVDQSIAALSVRAPIDGRLTDFHLQLGEIVKRDERVGRIDDPDQFKLSAQIDEYFLGRVLIGTKATGHLDQREFPLEVSAVFPQVRDGRFTADLTFLDRAPSSIKPGQSLETRIALGDRRTALVLPNDAFLAGGASEIYVVAPDGKAADRRGLRIGSRNNTQVEIESGLAAGERVIVSSYAAFKNAPHLKLEN